jgi:hypothetical protein
MQMARYVRVCKRFDDRGVLIPEAKLNDQIDYNREMYVSTYFYNEDHYRQYKERGSVAGIRDVTTNMLWFDFDSEGDTERARQDAVELTNRLKKYGVKEKDIEIYFSGNKGFDVRVGLNRTLTPQQVKALVIHKFGKGLDTLDHSLYDANQILRVPGTKHQKSGLHKIPLTTDELRTLPVEKIRDKAKSLDNVTEEFHWDYVNVDEEFLKVEKVEEPKKELVKIDLHDKPRHWKDYKWALLQGYYEKGERHSAMMVIAATCRGLGYDAETATAMCLAADKKHCERTEDHPIEDLESNIIPSVYSTTWQGGQYSPQNDPWLAKYCERMGFETGNDDMPTIAIEEAFTLFRDYASNIDELTVKTGIAALDRKLRMTIGMVVGIVAAPGVGKTSLALQMLNNMSKRGEQCIFFSYDMYHALVIQKLVQSHLKVGGDEIFDRIKNGDPEFEDQIIKMLKEEYANVEFCFKQGQTPKDIEETIKMVEGKTGKKVRFIVIDYGELVMSDLSDPTAASAQVQHKLRAIANTYNLCVLSLIQPNKMSGTPADDILSYRAAKGSSAIEQTVSVMLGVSRPGYDPRHPEDDVFMTVNAVKVRMGGLFSVDLHWDGPTGQVRELLIEEKEQLERVRNRKKEEDGEDDNWS